ncbi:MAG: helix-turn-helix transcriptional regulator [Verrucomicrobia bacterium]|nr:helix-turn-helix transcriptional regulator [Verrucomicrobiota bacterium]
MFNFIKCLSIPILAKRTRHYPGARHFSLAKTGPVTSSLTLASWLKFTGTARLPIDEFPLKRKKKLAGTHRTAGKKCETERLRSSWLEIVNKIMTGWQLLLETTARLPFERHDIASNLDVRGRYDVALDKEFPLLIKLFRYTSKHHTRGATWHDRLEIFMPLDGATRFRMGDQEVHLQKGDLLVVDNLKLHRVVDFRGFDTRVVVVSFLPEFVYSLGSPSHDYAFLLPFYSKIERRPHVIRSGEPVANEVHRAMACLLECYFAGQARPFFEAGSKAYLLQVLYHMAGYFRTSGVMKWEFMKQQQRSLQLKKLFEHISAHPCERLSVADASRLSGMTPPRFMKTFKQVAGTTLVAYLNHVRLANAARLLHETNHSIAEIATTAGFSDQSYFDRRFKRAFGQTPKDFRTRRVGK